MRMGKGHGQTADSLDPGTHENGFMLALVQGYNNYLTEVAGDGSLVGQLAESWDASADAATWTFKLRKGVTYHNGREIAAEDVVASINHHRGEESQSAAKPIVAPITGIKADGKHTVVFSLEAGNADFPFIVSDYHLPIMPSEGRQARLAGRHRRGRIQDQELRAGGACGPREVRGLLESGPRALRCGPDDQHHRPHRPHQRPHHRRGGRHRPGGF